MQETGILPDFIVVDGAEGGPGASPAEFIDHVGLPMHEALMLVPNPLVGIGLRNRIRVGAAGKINSASALARPMAMRPDRCPAPPRLMLPLRCTQPLTPHPSPSTRTPT